MTFAMQTGIIIIVFNNFIDKIHHNMNGLRGPGSGWLLRSAGSARDGGRAVKYYFHNERARAKIKVPGDRTSEGLRKTNAS